MAIPQDPHFQQCMEAYMDQNRDACFQHLINKGAKVPYNFDVDKKIQKHDPSMKEEIDLSKKQLNKYQHPRVLFHLIQFVLILLIRVLT